MSINHGDKIVLKGSPLHITGFTSYVKTFYNLLCLHWSLELTKPEDAIVFIIGDVKRSGQPIKTGEAVTIVSDAGFSPVLFGENIYYVEGWVQPAENNIKIVLSCDGVLPNTPLSYTMPYWISFAHMNGMVSWGLPKSPMLNLIHSFDSYKTMFWFENVGNHGGEQSGIVDNTTEETNPMNLPLPEKVYYTIDDCCSAYTDDTINYIDYHKLPVIWFVNGLASSQSPSAYKSLQKMCASPNCIIGIHTWDHRNMATQLSIGEVYKQISDTIALVEKAHASIGKKWEDPRLFRFPFTDAGQGLKYEELQQVLRNFKFVRHEAIQNSIYGRGIGISGLFVEDGKYKNSSTAEFNKHLHEQYNMFNDTFPALYRNTTVLGTHDTKHSITMLELLRINGVEFLDARKT